MNPGKVRSALEGHRPDRRHELESSAEYYRHDQPADHGRGLGGVHSARSLMWSVDFGEIERLQHEGDWAALSVADGRRGPDGWSGAGPDFMVLCTNTMHRCAEAIIGGGHARPCCTSPTRRREAITRAGFTRVGLLGTAFTMEQDFYKRRLAERFGLDVLVPEAEDRAHRARDHLSRAGGRTGRGRPRAPAYREVIQRLIDRGAEAIILGCTEDHAAGLGRGQLAVRHHPLHAEAAVDWALARSPVRSRLPHRGRRDGGPSLPAVARVAHQLHQRPHPRTATAR